MDIQIREATKADVPFIRAMIWEALLASPTFIQDVGIEKIQQHEDEYWNNWEKKQDPSFIAVDNNQQNIGAIVLYPNDEKSVESCRIGMGLIKESRGKGVGKLLIERALYFARRNNFKYINLFVDPKNIPAISLYKRMGFEEIGMKDKLLEMRIDL